MNTPRRVEIMSTGQQGWLLQFVLSPDKDTNFIIAIIETISGEIEQFFYDEIRFIDREQPSSSEKPNSFVLFTTDEINLMDGSGNYPIDGPNADERVAYVSGLIDMHSAFLARLQSGMSEIPTSHKELWVRMRDGKEAKVVRYIDKNVHPDELYEVAFYNFEKYVSYEFSEREEYGKPNFTLFLK